nr:MAG TPA: hypothetical protein [Caudoviricetes sp.]
MPFNSVSLLDKSLFFTVTYRHDTFSGVLF